VSLVKSALHKDGNQVGLGYISNEGAVAKDHSALASWGLFFVPSDNTESYRLALALVYGFGEADEQNAAADVTCRAIFGPAEA